ADGIGRETLGAVREALPAVGTAILDAIDRTADSPEEDELAQDLPAHALAIRQLVAVHGRIPVIPEAQTGVQVAPPRLGHTLRPGAARRLGAGWHAPYPDSLLAMSRRCLAKEAIILPPEGRGASHDRALRRCENHRRDCSQQSYSMGFRVP